MFHPSTLIRNVKKKFAERSWLQAIAQGATNLPEAHQKLVEEFMSIRGMNEKEVRTILEQDWGEEWKQDHYTQDDVTKLYQEGQIFPLKNAAFSLKESLILERIESIRYLKKKNCQDVLDYACGAGATSVAMKMMGIPNVYSGDISELILEVVSARLRLRGFPALTLNLLQPCHKVFDGVLVFDFFDLIAEPATFVEQFYQMTRPGSFVITNLRGAPKKKRTFRLGGRPQEVIELFLKQGFTIERQKQVPNNLFFIFRRN